MNADRDVHLAAMPTVARDPAVQIGERVRDGDPVSRAAERVHVLHDVPDDLSLIADEGEERGLGGGPTPRGGQLAQPQEQRGHRAAADVVQGLGERYTEPGAPGEAVAEERADPVAKRDARGQRRSVLGTERLRQLAEGGVELDDHRPLRRGEVVEGEGIPVARRASPAVATEGRRRQRLVDRKRKHGSWKSKTPARLARIARAWLRARTTRAC